ncbi:MAG: tryptophan--tRNA ligase, partial [Chloroflexota bacterium]|nr:tryptophan--tRNA ligase [Chloroflexota bacterium]
DGDELCVPVGEDDLPLLELSNDIAGWFNRTYDRVFLECTHRLSEVPRLMGTDGQAKMSKSLGNVILLSDDADAVQKKVMSMYTDPTRLRATDPGHVEGNPVFMYHDAFNPDVAEVDELKDRYRKGRVGDVEVKRRLFTALNAMLDPVRERREAFANDPDIVQEVLRTGIEQTRAVGGETMGHVRAAMYIDYANLLATPTVTG